MLLTQLASPLGGKKPKMGFCLSLHTKIYYKYIKDLNKSETVNARRKIDN